MYERTTTSETCVAEDFNVNVTINCEAYVYDDSQMTSTFVTETNLVCEAGLARRHFTTVLMLGLFFGSIIGGKIGDRFGRKMSLMASSCIIIPCVIIGGFIPNYYAYIILRFITGVAMPIAWINGSTYGLEYWSPRYRRLVICIRGKAKYITSFIMCLLIGPLSSHVLFNNTLAVFP